MARTTNPAKQRELTEFAVLCLVNAGRWAEVEDLVRRHPGCESSPGIALGLGTALLKQEKLEQAGDLFVRAYQADVSQTRLKRLAIQALLAQAIEQIHAKNWAQAGSALGRVLELDPGNRDAAQLQDSIQGMLPIARLMAGQRAEAAAHWEQEFPKEHSPQIAHHLAILYYWWAVQKGRNDGKKAEIWQKSIACWVYTLYDKTYWAGWREQKRAAYAVEDTVFATLKATVRKTFSEAIETLRLEGDAASTQFAEDLRMDCWAEFEVAELLEEGGNRSPCGPIFMRLFGWPKTVKTPASAMGERGLRLGKAELPFLPDAEILLEFCKAGYTRPLAYLANNDLDRAEQCLQRSQFGANTMGDGMRAYIAIQRAEQRFIHLKCPPEDGSVAAVQNYAEQIRAILNTLTDAQRYASTRGSKAALTQVIELFCRRIPSEFENFEADSAAIRASMVGTGIDLLERALQIVNVAEGQLALGAMVNRLALLLDSTNHDQRIRLFERAVQLAPQNDLYKRNLAFSFYNRASDIKQIDREGARRDILRAYQLAPDDDDILQAYHLVQGGR